MLVVGSGIAVYVARNQALIQPSVLVVVAHVFQTAALLALLANAVGWPAAPNGATYVTAVWLILAIGGINFVDLVANRVLEPPDA